ncbi:DUF4252 domain-containing protein [Flavimarina sp. Hel_I_48]|uniref:DUF4252 domain-containing protein n=1 Tax=Flavimarina sp. Hel_I_48 TaxID=1392488 RepID=UPI0004DF4A02|nr:DUF4252 domain-containing protein [Flavimarina sp. Hel_I_48]
MTKILISALVFLMGFAAQAQDPFQRFEDMQDVASIVVNQKMFKMLSQFNLDTDDPEMKSYIELVNSLDDIKFYSTKDANTAKLMRTEFDKYLGMAKLEELMRVKDDGKNVQFYVKPGKSDEYAREFLMFIDGINGSEDTVIAKITGNIDLREIGKIASSINFSGSEELKNVKIK